MAPCSPSGRVVSQDGAVRAVLLAAPVVWLALYAAERAAHGHWGAAVAFALPCFALLWLASRAWRHW